MYSIPKHRDQAATVFRVAGVDADSFDRLTRPLIDTLTQKSQRVISGVCARMLARFDGCLNEAPGLEAMFNHMRGLGCDQAALSKEQDAGFMAPLYLTSNTVENAAQAMQQLARLALQRSGLASDESDKKPGARFRPFEIEALLRYYAGAARFASKGSEMLALQAVEFDVAVVECAIIFTDVLKDGGVSPSEVNFSAQCWPVSRPDSWPYPSHYDRLGFTFGVAVNFSAESAKAWLNPNGPKTDLLAREFTKAQVFLSDQLSQIFKTSIGRSWKMEESVDYTTWARQARIPLKRKIEGQT